MENSVLRFAVGKSQVMPNQSEFMQVAELWPDQIQSVSTPRVKQSFFQCATR
jgi:hypothetical protein